MADTTKARAALEWLCPEDSLFVQWEGFDPRKTILSALDSHDALAAELGQIKRELAGERSVREAAKDVYDSALSEVRAERDDARARLAAWEGLRDDALACANYSFCVAEHEAKASGERLLAHLNREVGRGE